MGSWKARKIAKTGDGRARIMLKTEVSRLLTDRYGNECGVERTSADGKIFQSMGRGSVPRCLWC